MTIPRQRTGSDPLPPVGPPEEGQLITSAKIVVAGGFGVGKSTFVGSISEITPLRSEAIMTIAGIGVDEAGVVPEKSTTTAALDFGRLTIDDTLILYLFGTPGQERFRFMWDEMCRGAIGAVVLADTRRLDDCYDAVEYFDTRGMPFAVAVNGFAGAPRFPESELRQALQINQTVPLLYCDARQREQVRQTLVDLVEYVIDRRRANPRRRPTS